LASGVEPFVVGKPNPMIINLLCEKYQIDKSKSIMIGDNLHSDILLGKNSGVDTLLVLSGNTTL